MCGESERGGRGGGGEAARFDSALEGQQATTRIVGTRLRGQKEG